ncbi:uncharacterized protein TRAVEDRAFT_49799 [Trametes versicolor FP-101664 SS1]|uniref:uncharacterized protein n=1 Tax=Trametes versicolor (strain FP-101664) TaxID=717944 RepID=UPI000462156F|nr:uncharacterized protein TRAVEDRAFT_49799 [Trametes versicolor FP-101664 SS1]EIW56987.1 hypothetical protein TRAVEDRAFT_49799 [Trametes versicolor FP-101664 SS1]
MIRFRQLQAICNGRRTINRLPTEVFAEIFANALTEWTDNPYFLQDLSQVCSQWRRIIAGSPLLYRSFRLKCPRLTARHLRRSRTLPLDVDIYDVNLDMPSTVALMNSITVLSPQLDRVRWLNVTSHSSKLSAWILGMLEDLPHHRLTSLSLALSRPEWPASLRFPESPEAERVFRGLTSLTLQDPNIGGALLEPAGLRDSIHFNLRRLTLEFIVAVPPTNATLIHLLSRCPELEEFTLRSVDPVAFERTDRYGCPMCQLLKLRTFTYHAPNFKTLADITRHVEPNVFQMPKFDLSIPTLSDKAIAALLRRPSDDGKRAYQLACLGEGLRRMDVRCLKQQWQILGFYTKERTTSAPDVTLALEPNGLVTRSEPSLFFWSWPIKDVSSVTVLTFHLCRDFVVPPDAAQWTSLLRSMHSLETLVLVGAWWADIHQLFKALDPAFPDGSLLCPKMTTVELIDSDTVGYCQPSVPAASHSQIHHRRCIDIGTLGARSWLEPRFRRVISGGTEDDEDEDTYWRASGDEWSVGQVGL